MMRKKIRKTIDNNDGDDWGGGREAINFAKHYDIIMFNLWTTAHENTKTFSKKVISNIFS